MNSQTLNFENLLKKAILAAFLAIILFHFGLNDGNAQIIIGDTYKLAEGDAYTTVSADTAGINEGNSGANQTWDFSSLVLRTNEVSAYIIDPIAAPGHTNFPEADLAVMVESTYVFVKYDAESLITVGYIAEGSILRTYSDTQKQFEYPFSYNDTFTDTYKAVSTNAGNNTRSSGIVTTTADAYGTLILPSGTYNNSLRVKVVTQNTDSMTIGQNHVVWYTTTTNYNWYVGGLKTPLLSITYVQTPNITVKTVSYTVETVTGIEEPVEVVNDYKLDQNSPNPFNPSTSISFTIPASGFTSLKVYDLLGKEVATLVSGELNAGKHLVNFNASSLTSGVYFYRLETNGFTSVKKMSLIK